MEWTLFDLVFCQFNLLAQKQQQRASGQLIQDADKVHPLLREKKNQFIFNVTDESGELEVKPELTKDSCLFTEYSKCKLKIKNLSLNFALKNCYLLCSHPLLFGLEK